MRKFFRQRLLLLCIVLPLNGLSGQTSAGSHLDIGLGGGYAIPRGDFSGIAKTGYHIGLRGKVFSKGFLRIDAGLHYNNLGMEKEVLIAPFAPPVMEHGSLGYWMFSAGLAVEPRMEGPAPYAGVDALFNLLESTPTFESQTSHTGLSLEGGIAMPLLPSVSVDGHVQYQILNLFDKGGSGVAMTQLVAELSLFFTVL